MIYTVTLSPSIDYTLNLNKEFLKGNINRSFQENYEIGGKGINVSILLKNLGRETTVLGFVGGFTGEYIKETLNKKKIKNDFCTLEGITRTNIKINENNKESAINSNGPSIYDKNIDCLFEKIKKINDGDILVLAGNIPSKLDKNIYEKILEKIKDKKVNVVVDSTKEFLLSTLKHKPFLIKPNLEELEELFEVKIQSKEDIVRRAIELQSMGAKNILVSLGENGALFIDENKKVYEEKTYKGDVISTVGSGDSMIAGFISKYIENNNFNDALNFGIACGAATAFNKGIADSKEIFKILNKGVKCV